MIYVASSFILHIAGCGHSLLHLVAAVGGGEVDDEAQLAAGVRHVLPLEQALLRARRPRAALVRVQRAVHQRRGRHHAPAHRLQQLQHHIFIAQIG